MHRVAVGDITCEGGCSDDAHVASAALAAAEPTDVQVNGLATVKDPGTLDIAVGAQVQLHMTLIVNGTTPYVDQIDVVINKYTEPSKPLLYETGLQTIKQVQIYPDAGYWLLGANGTVHNLSGAALYGSLAGGPPKGLPPGPAGQVVGMAATPDGGGYWVVSANDTVTPFGDAAKLGSVAKLPPHGPAGQIVGIAAAATDGYWLVSANGTVYSCTGSCVVASTLPKGVSPGPVVGIAATPDGGGYWVVSANGTVTPFGDATDFCADSTCASLPSPAPPGPRGPVGPGRPGGPEGRVVAIAAP